MVGHTCNPSIQEIKSGESQVQDQSGLASEILSPKKKKKNTKNNDLQEVFQIATAYSNVYMCHR
jgi:hypothetical protein